MKGTALQFKKALATAPALKALAYIDPKKGREISDAISQQADDLDYVQTLVGSVLREPSINPSMNALTDAFVRRRFSGKFRTAGNSIEMETLLQKGTAGKADHDEGENKSPPRKERERTRVARKTSPVSRKPCFAFQTGNCNFRNCN